MDFTLAARGAAAVAAMKPPKVLHVVGMLGRWSVETWLLQMMAHAQTRGATLDWTFYCTFEGTGEKEDEARRLGAKVLRSPVPIGRKREFARALRNELRRGGYDVLHCHHDLISAVYLMTALGLPLRRRIVHVHNADESMLTPSPLKQALGRPLFRTICLALADDVIANSNHSLEVFLAGRPRDPRRHHVQAIAIAAEPFAKPGTERAQIRADLNIAPEAPVLLFAGRMTPEKNPVFAVDVLAALREIMPETIGVFAGDGSLTQAVHARAEQLGQSDAVRLLGWRRDIPDLMAAADWFILPHPHEPPEGFGIAVVEAQLAGLRMLLSEGVKDDPLLPTAVYRRLPLDAGAAAWALAACELWIAPAPSTAAALAALRVSPMDMDRALDDLLALYA
jgi:glycosyltransferase involved in cell wall biosynthesis